MDICKGLEYIHARSIIHCNVKLGNILIKSSSKGALLYDFGNTVTSLIIKGGGTLCYVLLKALYREWSFSKDIWGLGVALLFAAKLMLLLNRSWTITNIRTDVNAVYKMGDWLLYVIETIKKILKRLNLLCKMLENNLRNRILVRELVQDLERGDWLKGSKLMKIL